MYYECTAPEQFPDFDTEAKARLARGVNRERDLSIDLMRVGRLCVPKFEFVGQQERIQVKDRKGRVIISGKVDGHLRWESGAKWPLEWKSWSVFLTDRIYTFDDLYDNKWTWSGASQLLSYLYSENSPYGVIGLDRPGLPRLIQVNLEENLQQMEQFLQDATVVVDHIEKGEPPDYIDDPAECRSCPVFGSTCNPPLSYKGAGILVDEELLAHLEGHEALRDSKDTYDDAHDILAEHLKANVPKEFKGKNRRQIIAGPFVIEAWWGKQTTYPMTEAEKKQFAKVDDTGKLNWKVTRVDDNPIGAQL